jgi:hypothetical protein
MKEYRANNIGELIEIIKQIKESYGDARPWFRGNSRADWNLLPSLYRKGHAYKEQDMNNAFRNKAKSRYSNCPDREDWFSWLFLMQHYRLPTRLLDWSEAPLVALFFILDNAEYDDSDGALWALMPGILNIHQIGMNIICLAGGSAVEKLFKDAFIADKKNPDKKILAVATEQMDLRHLLQQSAFTIHGTDTPMDKIPESEKYLAKIVIPMSAKSYFREILSVLSISGELLFPDLENLAKKISKSNFQPVNPLYPNVKAGY